MVKYFLEVEINNFFGKHTIGYIENGILHFDEVYHFVSEPVKEGNHYVWNVKKIFSEVKLGIKKALEKYQNIEAMTITNDGVDYVLMNHDEVIHPVYSYIDNRLDDFSYKVHKHISSMKLYQITGTRYQKTKTIYQLYWDKIKGRLDKTTDFLMISEYFNYLLTGIKIKDRVSALATGLVDWNTQEYSQEIIEQLDFPRHLFPRIYDNDEKVAHFSREVVEELGGNMKVVFGVGNILHSIMQKTLNVNDNSLSAFIICDESSVVGMRNLSPLITEVAKKANFENDFFKDSVIIKKMFLGLSLMNRLRKIIIAPDLSVVQMAQSSKYQYLLDFNDPVLLSGENIKVVIRKWCYKRKLPCPAWDGDYFRTILCSQVYMYNESLKELEKISGKSIEKIFFFGEGEVQDFIFKQLQSQSQREITKMPISDIAYGKLIRLMKMA